MSMRSFAKAFIHWHTKCSKCMEGICPSVGLKKALARIRIWHNGSPYYVPILAHIQRIHIAFLL